MKQFKTRDSATAFMRKHGIKKEHYNNFITTDVIGGKPIFMVDEEGVLQYEDLKDTFGEKTVDGNYDRENADGTVSKGDYYNEDGSLKKDEPVQGEEQPDEQVEDEQVEEDVKTKTVKSKKPKKTPPLAGSALDERSRERLAEKKKQKEPVKKYMHHEQRKHRHPKDYPDQLDENGKLKQRPSVQKEPIVDAPATKGILKRFPYVRTKSIRAFIVDLLLEGVDHHTIYGGMKEVFGKDKCIGKERYPEYYSRELVKLGQLNSKGKPHKH